MDVEFVRRYCLSLPHATENLQWGEDLCFKVGGKIFATIALGAVPQCMSFKCTPEKFTELLEIEGAEPAPYVGRYKWVLLRRLDVLAASELEALIRESYDMVAAKAKIPSRKSQKKLTTSSKRKR
jgi:predicted DNA-binding protein (MmcQ/YjbR family)